MQSSDAHLSHFIHRQVLDLTLGSEREAFAAQEAVRRVYYARVVPLLDEVFSSLVGPHEVVRLDRLELDLGRLSPQTMEEDLVNTLRRQLREALTACLSQAVAEPDQLVPTFLTPAQSSLASLLVFLETGHTPWWLAAPEAFDPDEEIRRILDEAPEALTTALRERNTPGLCLRLVRQLTRTTLERLITVLAPSAAASLAAFRRDWTRVRSARPEPTISSTAFTEVLWLATLDEALMPSPKPSAFNSRVLDRWAALEGSTPDVVLQRLAASAANTLPAEAPLAVWIRSSTTHPATSPSPNASDLKPAPGRPARLPSDEPTDVPDAPKLRGRPEATGSDLKPKREGRSAPVNERPEAEPPRLSQSEAPGFEQETVQHITNAGLILVWPFLKPFFEQVGLLRQGRFATDEAQRRAVLLTQYVVTTETDHPEHRLLLNKLLCGLPPSAPVERRIRLTDEEMAGCRELLESVITHWSALKNTSVEGFRAAFLKRNGRLAWQEGAWLLTVERTAYDVLLETLPWGLSLVMHPWMHQPIYVEW